MKKITKQIACKVLEVVDKGLSMDIGDPIPGKMCVEAAVCYAMGEPHGDHPRCVNGDLRDFKIALNDMSGWSSNKSRARGLRRIAIAQLGTSEGFVWEEFRRRLVYKLALAPMCDKLTSGNRFNSYLINELSAAKNYDDVEMLLLEWNEYTSYSIQEEVEEWRKLAKQYCANSSSSDFMNDLMEYIDIDYTNAGFKRFADAAADVLKDMKTPGSKYLYLTDKKIKAKAR